MTPQQLLDRLDTLLPGFRSHWNCPQNCFVGDDGSYTLHGVFCELTDFFRHNHAALPVERIATLGAFVNKCMAAGDDDSLANAAATCFLENIAGDDSDRILGRHLTGPARRYWLAWSGRDAELSDAVDGGT